MDGKVIIGTDLDLKGLETKMSDLSNTLEKSSIKAAENAANKSSKRFNAAFALGVSALSSIMTKALTAITNTIGEAITRVDTIENFPKVMGNLGISSKDAAVSVEYLSEKLIGLPTTLDAGVRAVQRFTSANSNVKVSSEMFLALNNAILAGGTSMQQQQIALEQLSQAYARGKPDMMEWRTAMTTMPAQLKQVAMAMGYVNSSQLGEALRKGKVSMNDFMFTLIEMNKKGVGGFASLEEQARTGTRGIQTSLTNLKTTLAKVGAEILRTIGQTNISNFFQTIINFLNAITPYISSFVKSFITAINAIGAAISFIVGKINGLFGKKAVAETKKTSEAINTAGLSMKGLKNNTDATTDSTKKLNKALKSIQSFDEMNVLPDNTNNNAGASDIEVSGGDLGDLSNVASSLSGLDTQIKSLSAATDLFTAAVWGLIAAWGTFKLLKLLDYFGLISLSIGEMLKIAVGVGLIVGGIVLIIKGVIDYLKNPTWGNFLKILGGIALVVAGVALIFGGIPALITAIIAVIGALGLAVYKHWDDIKKVLSAVGTWINDNVIKPTVKFFSDLWKNIKNGFKALWDSIKNIFSPVAEVFKSIFTAAFKAIKSVFSPMVNFFSELWNKIKSKLKEFGMKFGEIIGGSFKGVINGVIGAIEGILNFPIKSINKLINVINKIPGINIGNLPTFNLPRLAKGGIINIPGRGVPVGQAIGGEAGREGVIPLTDSQQMALLGEAIGKYITLNATIPVYVGNRQVTREMRKINAEDDFATNS